MSLYPLQPSFAAGELTPSLWGRVDMAKYNVGLKVCENFVVHPHGGVSRRVGTHFVARALGPCRLVPFVYNESVAYVIELSNGAMRFFRDGELLDARVETPYSEAELWDLSFAQSADVLYICHKNHPPMELARYGDTHWTLSVCRFSPPPFKTQSAVQAAVTMTPAGTSGSVALEASAAVFEAGMKGSAIALIQHADEDYRKVTENAVEHTDKLTYFYDVGVARFLSSVTTDEQGKTTYNYVYSLTVSAARAGNLAVGDRVSVGSASGTVSSITALTSSNCAHDTVGCYEPGHEGEYAVGCAGFTVRPSIDGENATFSAERTFKATANWGTQVTVYKSWRLESYGFWAGTVLLQRYDADEGRWITMKTYTSVESEHSGRNYTDSGEFDEATQLRIVSDSYYGFVPKDNVGDDRGYFVLVAEEADHLGWGTIAAVNSVTSAVVDVAEPFVSTTGTALWQLGSWSEGNGYPRAVGFYQERLCFGGSVAEPQTVWMSRTGDYYNFGTSSPVKDDDAISATLASRQVNVIRHFVGLGSLIVLTSGSEWLISADGAITPKNINAKPQGYRGCTGLDPIVVGNMVLFVQSQGCRVRDLGYQYETDSYTGNDLSIMAAHLLRDASVRDWCWQQEPDSMAWIVRTDGVLMSLTYLREHDVYAWARHPTDGVVESVAAVPGASGSDVYLSVVRGGVRVIERMAPRPVTTAAEAYYLDSGVSVRSEEGVRSVSGLSHLAGRKVQVLADGSFLGEFAVSPEGTVALPKGAKVVHAGLGYKSKLRTLDLGFQRADGTQLTRRSRVSAVALRVERTRGLWAGVDEDHLQESIDRTAEPYDAATGLRSCDLHLSLSSSYVDYGGGSVWVETKDPFPASVLAVVPEVSAGG
ncbi:MAG: hypothetical protein ACOYD9_07380 [Pyramidobacter sp.]|jgi:hypothetical protein